MTNKAAYSHFIAGVAPKPTRRVVRDRSVAAKPLSSDEEAFLSGVTASGQFTLDKVKSMYAGVERIRRVKSRR